MYLKTNIPEFEMIPKKEAGDYEKRFVEELVRLVEAVSNELMGWYGDVEFDKSTSGYIITWKPKRNPRKLGIGTEAKNE